MDHVSKAIKLFWYHSSAAAVLSDDRFFLLDDQTRGTWTKLVMQLHTKQTKYGNKKTILLHCLDTVSAKSTRQL